MDKYKTEEDRTLTRKISKLNMHSINKKSSRMGQKFLNTIGKDPAVRMRSLDYVHAVWFIRDNDNTYCSRSVS